MTFDEFERSDLERISRLENETIYNLWRNIFCPRNVAVYSWGATILLVLLLFMSGCSTTPPVPLPVERTTVGFAGNHLDGGVISVDPGKGVHVRTNIVDRYNGLALIYGTAFLPELTPNKGVSFDGDLYYMDMEHFLKYLQMNRWHRMGSAPVKIVN